MYRSSTSLRKWFFLNFRVKLGRTWMLPLSSWGMYILRLGRPALLGNHQNKIWKKQEKRKRDEKKRDKSRTKLGTRTWRNRNEQTGKAGSTSLPQKVISSKPAIGISIIAFFCSSSISNQSSEQRTVLEMENVGGNCSNHGQAEERFDPKHHGSIANQWINCASRCRAKNNWQWSSKASPGFTQYPSAPASKACIVNWGRPNWLSAQKHSLPL